MSNAETTTDDFLGRAVGDLAAGYLGVMISLGHKLGLYHAMAGAGPLTSLAIAKRAGCAERYVREWLNSQAAAGYVIYEPVEASYELPDAHIPVLADTESPFYLPVAWQVPASMWFDEEKSLNAFRTGEGVPWGDHDSRLYCGVAAFFRNAYKGSLVSQWLPALDGVEDRLKSGIHVADIGCGHGHSTVLMAEAFPNSTFWGFDNHPASISATQETAREAGVQDRVHFQVAGAQDVPARKFDLICFFDCLHDMGDPVGATRKAKEQLAEGGTVLLIEPFANDRVEDNIGPVGQLYYAASTTLCCAHSLSEDVGRALGAQAGETELRDVFREAGFGHFRRAMETPFNLILEARH